MLSILRSYTRLVYDLRDVLYYIACVKVIKIIEFDAMIDDFVDVTMHSMARLKTVLTWRWQAALTAAFIAAVPAYFLFSGTTAVQLIVTFAVAVVAAALSLWTA